jgi:hypothetical protein
MHMIVESFEGLDEYPAILQYAPHPVVNGLQYFRLLLTVRMTVDGLDSH